MTADTTEYRRRVGYLVKNLRHFALGLAKSDVAAL